MTQVLHKATIEKLTLKRSPSKHFPLSRLNVTHPLAIPPKYGRTTSLTNLYIPIRLKMMFRNIKSCEISKEIILSKLNQIDSIS